MSADMPFDAQRQQRAEAAAAKAEEEERVAKEKVCV